MPGRIPVGGDAALLERIAERDQEALGELYDRHARLLFSLILRILRDRGDAEDVLQDVFVRVWDRADAYDPALGAPVAWLVRIARNRAIDRLRARATRPQVDTPDVPEQRPAPGPSPEQAAAQSEAGRGILAALGTLPGDQRLLIERAFFEGLTHMELAAALGLPLGTVKTRIRTGMQALRRQLEPRGGVE